MRVIIDIPNYARNMAAAKLLFLAPTKDEEQRLQEAIDTCEQQPVTLDLSEIDPVTIADALANMAFSAIMQTRHDNTKTKETS